MFYKVFLKSSKEKQLLILKAQCVAPLAAVLIALISLSCSEKRELPPIDLNIARPIDVVASQERGYFYVLNSDLNHVYGSGSLLIIDQAGVAKKSYRVSRLGRSLSLKGNDLLVSYDSSSDPGSKSRFELYQLEDDVDGEPSLKLVKSWSFDDCSPINAVLSEGYLAATCFNGKLLAGSLATPRKKSTFKEVRKYPSYHRRAIHIDQDLGLLYAFVTNMGRNAAADTSLLDSKSWNASTQEHEDNQANDVPDAYEDDISSRRRLSEQGSRYQFVVYDLQTEAEKKFPFKDYSELVNEEFAEMRWMYFGFADEVVTSDADKDKKASFKDYRTNFWTAKASTQAHKFYLSHRGRGAGENDHVNGLIEVGLKEGVTREDILDKTKLTNEVFQFTRAFEITDSNLKKNKYIGDFALVNNSQQQETFLVNSFRDAIYFDSETEGHYSILTKVNQSDSEVSEVKSSSPENSYYQLATLSSESDQSVLVMTCSFFGDAMVIFKMSENSNTLDLIKKVK